jgi:hypothetical protein
METLHSMSIDKWVTSSEMTTAQTYTQMHGYDRQKVYLICMLSNFLSFEPELNENGSGNIQLFLTLLHYS